MAGKLLVATRKGLFTLNVSDDGSVTIDTEDFVGDRLSLAVFDRRSNRIYAAMALGHFGPKLRCRDLNDSDWTEMTLPEYPSETEASLNEIWAITPGHADQSGRLWLGTIPGGVFKTDDSGESWEFVDSLWNMPERQQWFGGGTDHPVVNTIILDPDDSRTVTLSVSCGGVWRSTDDGTTWKCFSDGMTASYMPPEQSDLGCIQDVHRLAMCTAAPQVLWNQHHDRMYKSENGGESWKALEPPVSGFGFACAAHPTDPSTAWFVPAHSDQHRVPVDKKIVVLRTRDGGASFNQLTTGLPQRDAYDLVLRHALEVSDDGQCLAMGSSTGSLWISVDQGDTWKTAFANFPPIYSVSWV